MANSDNVTNSATIDGTIYKNLHFSNIIFITFSIQLQGAPENEGEGSNVIILLNFPKSLYILGHERGFGEGQRHSYFLHASLQLLAHIFWII